MQWHPLAEKFNYLDGDDWKEFKAGIKATGGCKEDPVKYRVLPDGKMQGLDGRMRYKACKELGLKCEMKKVTVPDEEVVNYILRRNVNRRHMDADLRQRLVIELRHEGESLRTIASTLGVDEKTVRNDLSGPGAEYSAPDGGKVTGKDGKQYEATKVILCRRCTRFGAETPASGCERCKAERAKAQRKKAERETSKRKQGDPVFDVKQFNDAFGFFLRQIDNIGRPFKAQNSTEAEGFREDFDKLKGRILEWQRALANVATRR
jgi:hypothetical protein